jgi:integrase
MPYQVNKGTGSPTPPKGKPEDFKFLTTDQLAQMLSAIKSDTGNLQRERDWHIIFLGFYLGLRAQECARLTRNCFRMIDQDQVVIPTLKQAEKLKIVCKNCLRTRRLSVRNSGKTKFCDDCQTEYVVPVIEAKTEPVDVSLNMLEPQVLKVIKAYLATMRKDQLFLFEPRGAPGHPLQTRQLNNIFNTYAHRIGLDSRYTFHSLRHGRGVQVYEKFEEQKMVQQMLRHSSIKTSEIYIHLSPKSKLQRRERLAQDFAIGGLD